MVIEQILSETRVRHYSDRGMMIRQAETGNLYEDAVDAIPCRFTYEETDKTVPDYGEDATADDYEAALNRLGVET